MKTKITKVERVESETMPPGRYDGTWCGYVITVTTDGGKWQLKTLDGVRGIVPCVVTVDEVGNVEAEG